MIDRVIATLERIQAMRIVEHEALKVELDRVVEREQLKIDNLKAVREQQLPMLGVAQ
jgi:hypothetical protein